MKFVIAFIAAVVATIILFAFCGCGSTKTISDQTTTTVTDHVIHPPAIHDTIKVTLETPVYIQGDSVVKGDTVLKVQYYPVEKRFVVYAKPDTIITHDTLIVQKIVQEHEPGFFERVWTWVKQSIMLIGVAVVGLILLGIYLKFIKK